MPSAAKSTIFSADGFFALAVVAASATASAVIGTTTAIVVHMAKIRRLTRCRPTARLPSRFVASWRLVPGRFARSRTKVDLRVNEQDPSPVARGRIETHMGMYPGRCRQDLTYTDVGDVAPARTPHDAPQPALALRLESSLGSTPDLTMPRSGIKPYGRIREYAMNRWRQRYYRMSTAFSGPGRERLAAQLGGR